MLVHKHTHTHIHTHTHTRANYTHKIRYFKTAHVEFHLKIAFLLSDMTPETRDMLGPLAGMGDVEHRLVQEIMRRNREPNGAALHG